LTPEESAQLVLQISKERLVDMVDKTVMSP